MDRDQIKKLMMQANDGGYAIPAFNYTSIYDFLAIIEAAEEENSPVILMAGPGTANTLGFEITGAMGVAAIKKASVPVIHHLDHSPKPEFCKCAIENGYPSVMIDASPLPLEENIKTIKEVTDFAHQRGVFVEGEIGRIRGADADEGTYEADDFLVDVDEAVQLAKESNVDSLAIGIGNAHGFYKGKPQLNFERLAEVNNAIDTPLVLHGGTGIPLEDVQRAIRSGINKVNIGTQIRYTYLKATQEELAKRGLMIHTTALMQYVKVPVKEEVKRAIRMCMSNGKA